MQIITPNMEVEISSKSIFLAGPINRDPNARQWHEDAFPLFEKWGFDGQVFSPAHIKCAEEFDYTSQIEWEHRCLKGATIVMFWVPRNLTDLPALTTNVEFGLCLGGWKTSPGQVVYGRPDDAVKCRYLDELYLKEGRPDPQRPLTTLEDTIKASLIKLDYFLKKGW